MDRWGGYVRTKNPTYLYSYIVGNVFFTFGPKVGETQKKNLLLRGDFYLKNTKLKFFLVITVNAGANIFDISSVCVKKTLLESSWLPKGSSYRKSLFLGVSYIDNNQE